MPRILQVTLGFLSIFSLNGKLLTSHLAHCRCSIHSDGSLSHPASHHCQVPESPHFVPTPVTTWSQLPSSSTYSTLPSGFLLLEPCSHSSWGILLKHTPEHFISLRRTHFHADCSLLSSLICTLTFCLGSLPTSPSVCLLLSLAETLTRSHLRHSQSSHIHILLDLDCTSPSGSTHSLNMLTVPDLSSVSCVSSNLTVHPRPTPYCSCTSSFKP